MSLRTVLGSCLMAEVGTGLIDKSIDGYIMCTVGCFADIEISVKSGRFGREEG